jgi:multiple sugar transport system substrate-binding protein
MPQKLTVSVMFHSDKTNSIQADLDRYGKENGIDIVQQEFDYTTGWSDFMRMAIYGGNPDVSEIGSTWLNDFAAMGVLRPFSASEVQNLDGSEAFVTSVWASGASSGAVWAIPWMIDLSLVYYRRDLLVKAGVEEEHAFQSPERFEQTLQQLQDAGIPAPWVVPTHRSYINIHNLAMWVWWAGEDFLDKEGKTILLDRPGVRSAILSFLRLHRFIPKEMYHLADHDADQMFNDGKVAVVIGGPWNIIRSARTPDVTANLGLAIPLGCSYTGGSSLIVWERTDQVAAAMELIAHLTSQEFQTTFPKRVGLLPGRLDSLDSFPLPDLSLYPVVLQALKTGRSLPNLGLWGLIEDRLVNVIPKLWDDILACPHPDLEALYDKHISPLTNRLNIILSQSQ